MYHIVLQLIISKIQLNFPIMKNAHRLVGAEYTLAAWVKVEHFEAILEHTLGRVFSPYLVVSSVAKGIATQVLTDSGLMPRAEGCNTQACVLFQGAATEIPLGWLASAYIP